ncbi:nucleotidyl transferase AbiEii/AbiGii toxin family protein [Kribbella sp. NPDC050281]|uniref:nucleotidyl transferase AbiEii/AbiGii toxin family protein n=1 Tax=Kribbella sp. NPDC050281 TaxID=3155515 RepID=UPI0033DADC7D
MTPDRVGLTAFQIEVAQMFFSLPASSGFLLAGGAALAAQQLTSRPTRDLDFFTGPDRGDVPTARDAFEVAAAARGWSVRRVRDSETFCRIVVFGSEDLLVDLAMDSAPSRPSTVSIAGPTFGLEELAGRKVIALFDRAEARDFADVYVLAQRYDKSDLLAWAAEVDAGFSAQVFAEMTGAVARFTDSELPCAAEDVEPLREFFAEWAVDLRATEP